MSFGFSVSDFLLLLKMTKGVYNACKDGPKEYQEISREAMSFYTVLESLKNDVNEADSLLNRRGSGRCHELRQVISHCEEAFRELQALVDKHSRLDAEGHRRIWESYQVGSADLGNVRGKLTFYVSVIGIFMDSLGASAMERIERKLDKLFAKVMEADTYDDPAKSTTSLSSTISLLSIRHSEKEDDVWDLIRHELQAEGIDLSTLEAYKPDIVNYLKSLVEKTDIERLQSARPGNDHNVLSIQPDQALLQKTTAQTAVDEPQLRHNERPTILMPSRRDTQTFEFFGEQKKASIQIWYTYRAQLGLYRNKPVCFIGIEANVEEKVNGPRINMYRSQFSFSLKNRDPTQTGSIWQHSTPLSQENRTDGSNEYVLWREGIPFDDRDTYYFKTYRDVESRLPPLHVGFMLAGIPEFPLRIRFATALYFERLTSSFGKLISWLNSQQLLVGSAWIDPPQSDLVITEGQSDLPIPRALGPFKPDPLRSFMILLPSVNENG
ncbi:hypothetical protein EPUS_03008 [Endocarpon pusillum Z07020]|uniref:Fungal N-terminal domain-containing protein n=1 Tax=Endocarpon pusillum (strain Z07020 / HMAS-L-300199) TaxID=1263415 RepID=U1G701_ENDPU|nr:uncharacterized protein EPUS_03008 [Endocarpon pusillum Z07020]ERF73167.1 hypothetical protein EPUS_03008 [Endocarpon pusillum Z07020]